MSKFNLAIVSVFLVFTSCTMWEKPQERIPTATIAAQTSNVSKRMVIVLPGYGDTVTTLKKSGIASVIQHAMPDVDVVLVQLSFAYYMEGRAVQRLHDEVIQPAKQNGVGDIYLAGASMGGMGVLMYERTYPKEMRGLILMAPFMGDEALTQEIESSGGLSKWDAGPKPAQLNRDNTPRENWRVVQSWVSNTERARNVWLICGQSDRFHQAANIIGSALPTSHYITPIGGHGWKVWNRGAEEVFASIAAEK